MAGRLVVIVSGRLYDGHDSWGCSFISAESPRPLAMPIPIRIAPPGGEDLRIWSPLGANRWGFGDRGSAESVVRQRYNPTSKNC